MKQHLNIVFIEEGPKRVEKAYEDGHVADEDIPESARKPDGDDKDKVEAKKKKATKKRGRVSFESSLKLWSESFFRYSFRTRMKEMKTTQSLRKQPRGKRPRYGPHDVVTFTL